MHREAQRRSATSIRSNSSRLCELPHELLLASRLGRIEPALPWVRHRPAGPRLPACSPAMGLTDLVLFVLLKLKDFLALFCNSAP